jgi:hypothetical protein
MRVRIQTSARSAAREPMRLRQRSTTATLKVTNRHR